MEDIRQLVIQLRIMVSPFDDTPRTQHQYQSAQLMEMESSPPNERVATEPSPKETYLSHKATIREIIAVDHFSNTVPDSIVDLWLRALDPEGRVPLPPGVKGFYGGDLRSSIPIELAHDCYKYVMHETDTAKVEKYANRMLVVLALLDMEKLSTADANLAGLALWHKALAQARHPVQAMGLKDTLEQYGVVRPRASLSDAKLPQMPRLVARLLAAAEQTGNDEAAECLRTWMPEEGAESFTQPLA
ncbi:hypothetical protein B0I35DRAFT_407612 [Stachybotrys elegans]|uniref:Uncharacterized protein n=1 Tax=Stachybotrys elegans TaxID=80388 RepID=A0A8K0SWC4_9HYPO|nr:hypothetical protein B0I35DRAFT_407612 [Stachybotrys elegans]